MVVFDLLGDPREVSISDIVIEFADSLFSVEVYALQRAIGSTILMLHNNLTDDGKLTDEGNSFKLLIEKTFQI